MDKSIIVVDLDGTLCISTHREAHARAKEWDTFHSLLHLDECRKSVSTALSAFSVLGFSIWAVSGRPERYRAETVKWLHSHNVPIDSILLRPNDDFRSDHELKVEMLVDSILSRRPDAHKIGPADALQIAQEAVLFVLDDRDKVVAAWRDNGFECWQVQTGGY